MRGLIVALLVLGLATSIDGFYEKDSKVISLDDKVRQNVKSNACMHNFAKCLLCMLSTTGDVQQQSDSARLYSDRARQVLWTISVVYAS
jgi:hypothetical protein